MTELWSHVRDKALKAAEPLAQRMRPRTIDQIVGQSHILGPGKLLRKMIEADTITSILLHGPPGTGKTTLAHAIANTTGRSFVAENAAAVGVARIREILAHAKERLTNANTKTILFLDEIHRFSKSQQDVLLADVEKGLITLVGATTENPLFAVNSALVSRSTLFRLEPLSEDEIIEVLRRAIADEDNGFGKLNVRADDDALRVWAIKSDGDARRALTALEVAVLSAVKSASEHTPITISRQDAEESIQQKAAVYGPGGDQHYDAISAFIKSVRGSDPDAAIYWLAHMLDAGEDPRFIARRLAILASEDIGNADPRAISVAAATWELAERIGMPEARITLAQCTTYLALAPKSNASYAAINAAMADVKQGRTVPVPKHLQPKLRPPPTPEAGPKPAYEYTHTEGIKTSPTGVGIVGTQPYLGVDATYYTPTTHGYEARLKERLDEIKRLRTNSR